jgi:hypothetical protein
LLKEKDAESQFTGAYDAESAEPGEQKLLYELHAAELDGGD